MTKTILLILGICLSACNKTDDNSASTGLFTRTIRMDDLTREYAIYIPENDGKTPMPLIFVLHGGGGNIRNMTGQATRKSPYKLWMEIADREKCIVIYPQALDGPSGLPNWNDCRANTSILPDVDDVKFITSLMDHTAGRYPVDTDRIYVTGISNGGIMTLRLASQVPQRLAAVAPISASLPDSSKCPLPGMPLSILFMNGTADPLLPYDGGTIGNPPDPRHGSVMPVETSVKLWITIDETDTVPQVTHFPDKDPDDESTVTRYTWEGGTDATEVVLYKITGGGHSAPSIREQYPALWLRFIGAQNHDVEMVDEIWDFFSDKKRRNLRP